MLLCMCKCKFMNLLNLSQRFLAGDFNAPYIVITRMSCYNYLLKKLYIVHLIKKQTL